MYACRPSSQIFILDYVVLQIIDQCVALVEKGREEEGMKISSLKLLSGECESRKSMRAYSEDLRSRIVHAVDQGKPQVDQCWGKGNTLPSICSKALRSDGGTGCGRPF